MKTARTSTSFVPTNKVHVSQITCYPRWKKKKSRNIRDEEYTQRKREREGAEICFHVGMFAERRGSGRWSVTFLSPLPFAARGTRRYDDINLTCTRVHCYDNVFKCQPVGTSKGERWSGAHTSARACRRAVSFRADVSTRTSPRPGRLHAAALDRQHASQPGQRHYSTPWDELLLYLAFVARRG